ncbi:MAG: hypothetical protein AAB355_01160 [Patescibacteria group bacterium]
MKKTRTQRNKGITLIEALISTTLFSAVMLISIGALLMVNDSNRKSGITRTVMDNLNLAMESMARNLRIGYDYHCDGLNPVNPTVPANCPSGNISIAFEGYKGNSGNNADQIIYRLNNGQIERSIDGGGTYVILTSPELSVDNLLFYVTGALPGDGAQPRVVIVLSGSAVFKGAIKTDFKVQTTISQRRIDS